MVKPKKEKRIPLYFTVNQTTKDYLDSQVEKTGLTMSSVIQSAISREKEQVTSLDTLAELVKRDKDVELLKKLFEEEKAIKK
jgi:hypothetical protein